MYRYRNADTDSVVKQALRLKLRKNGSAYVAKWRRKSSNRMREEIRRVIYQYVDCLLDPELWINQPGILEHLKAHRGEIIKRVQAACGDFHLPISVWYAVLPDGCYAYLIGTIEIVKTNTFTGLRLQVFAYIFSKVLLPFHHDQYFTLEDFPREAVEFYYKRIQYIYNKIGHLQVDVQLLFDAGVRGFPEPFIKHVGTEALTEKLLWQLIDFVNILLSCQSNRFAPKLYLRKWKLPKALRFAFYPKRKRLEHLRDE
jgi:hypothetical protein